VTRRLRLPSPLSLTAGVLLIAGIAPPSRAVEVSAATSTAPSESFALVLYQRAQTAARTVAYDGVKMVSREDENGAVRTSVVNVSHVPGVGVVVEVDDGDGTGAGETFTRASRSTSDADDATALRALERSYRLRSAGETRATGRTADVVEVQRLDGTVAARLLLDDETGLVLRREILDQDGRAIETSGFVKVRIGDPDLKHLPPMAPTPWTVLAESEVASLRADGWPVPTELGGGHTLTAVRRDTSGDEPVVQLGYTDGLAYMSVFVQRGALATVELDGYRPSEVDGGVVWVRSGGPPFVVWQSGEFVVTATSDTVAAPLAEVVAVLPADAAPADDVGARVNRGVQRVGSWFNPLD
jgi:hypothetical protein